MSKTLALTAGTTALLFLMAAGIVFGQTASPSPSASPSPTSNSTTNNTPSGAPATGLGGG